MSSTGRRPKPSHRDSFSSRQLTRGVRAFACMQAPCDVRHSGVGSHWCGVMVVWGHSGVRSQWCGVTMAPSTLPKPGRGQLQAPFKLVPLNGKGSLDHRRDEGGRVWRHGDGGQVWRRWRS
eukprot:351596-Chlamydomonas_euryale.AAC.5